MEGSAIYTLEGVLPAGCLAVGPASWAPGEGTEVVASVRELEALLAGDDASRGALVLLHGDHLGVAENADAALACLDCLQAHSRDLVAVLFYRSIPAETTVRLFRAGLFDAVRAPDSGVIPAAVLKRAAARLAALDRRRDLLRETASTSRLLREHRERLAREADLVGERLAATRRQLETANRELTDHMAQLSLLYKFGRELSAAANWDQTLEAMLENLAGFVGASGAALVLRPGPDAPFSPRRTFQWEDSAWDKMMRRLESERKRLAADGGSVSGVFTVAAESAGDEALVAALPLEFKDVCLGYLLLLEFDPDAETGRFLPFLQAVRIILGEEVASAQMLDRMRELGTFNSRVLETVRSGIWVVDDQGRTIYCNRTGRTLLTGADRPPAVIAEPAYGIGRGRGADAVAASASFFRRDAFRNDDLPELFLDGMLRLDDLPEAPYSALCLADGGRHHGEGCLERPDGEVIPVMAQTSAMPGRGRDERWLVVVLEDLRETRRLEAERQRADSLQGMVEMSATLAHEIRNPLMGLSAQAELLAESLDPDDRRGRYIDVITGEVARINDTITRLLHFVRPYEPQRTEVRVPDMVRDCLDLAAPRAEARSLDLESMFEPDAADRAGWTLSLDGGQIKQVLLNLVLNACDAAPEGSKVTVRARCEDRLALADGDTGAARMTSGAVLEIVDRGPGIPPGDQEKIFRPFYTTKSAGTGLGLSICRKIVEAHGGAVTVANETDGTVFRVLLPRHAAEQTLKEGLSTQ